MLNDKLLPYKEYINDISTTACFTGHRNGSIPEALVKDNYAALIKALYHAAIKAYGEGYRTFITGMADGVDMAAGMAVIQLMHSCPDVELIGALPYVVPTASKNDTHRKDFEFKQICAYAHKIYYLSQEIYTGVYHVRNRFMLDHSSLLIAAYDRGAAEGGTVYTMKEAKRRNIEIYPIVMNDIEP